MQDNELGTKSSGRAKGAAHAACIMQMRERDFDWRVCDSAGEMWGGMAQSLEYTIGLLAVLAEHAY